MSEDSGFFSRWSRRKVESRQGLTSPEPPPAAPPPPPIAQPAPVVAVEPPAVAAPPAEPPPTLEDVARLPSDASDFSRFVARDVQPEVKNAALRKLFSDPHFNVMDGLDTYIDDYSQPDPLPAGMLRQMVQSQLLGLFSDEQPTPKPEPDHKPEATAAPPAQDAGPVAAPETPETSSLALPSHEDADLRLQPDPAAGPDSLAAGLEPGAGREH